MTTVLLCFHFDIEQFALDWAALCNNSSSGNSVTCVHSGQMDSCRDIYLDGSVIGDTFACRSCCWQIDSVSMDNSWSFINIISTTGAIVIVEGFVYNCSCCSSCSCWVGHPVKEGQMTSGGLRQLTVIQTKGGKGRKPTQLRSIHRQNDHSVITRSLDLWVNCSQDKPSTHFIHCRVFSEMWSNEQRACELCKSCASHLSLECHQSLAGFGISKV